MKALASSCVILLSVIGHCLAYLRLILIWFHFDFRIVKTISYFQESEDCLLKILEKINLISALKCYNIFDNFNKDL